MSEGMQGHITNDGIHNGCSPGTAVSRGDHSLLIKKENEYSKRNTGPMIQYRNNWNNQKEAVVKRKKRKYNYLLGGNTGMTPSGYAPFPRIGPSLSLHRNFLSLPNS
ncbi:hypothetical protein TWF718_001354 [Orbilia javanica]|uniref:Uncharacterized protein n=1 Tax=Orbilia javanica TaxID=47235 RepID=A0AAN8MYP1_9PEZI